MFRIQTNLIHRIRKIAQTGIDLDLFTYSYIMIYCVFEVVNKTEASTIKRDPDQFYTIS